MYNKETLRTLINDVLRHFEGLHSPAAVELIMGTIAHESHMGKYRRQINGPARGIIQMEPATEKDIWENYLFFNWKLRNRIKEVLGITGISPDQLEVNDYYAVVMCRIHYLRVPHSLPSEFDLPALAKYWKQFYNTRLGKGTEKKYIDDYNTYIK